MRYNKTMKNLPLSSKYRHNQLPLFVEKDEDDFYVVECPLFEGCYSQGKTLDEALQNIREVVTLILQEKTARHILKSYQPRELSLHTITL
jgi:predicted RNase H-like HicB family nuclease